MTKYEYLIYTPQSNMGQQAEFNKLGDQGWKLVNATGLGYVFKRVVAHKRAERIAETKAHTPRFSSI